MPRIARTVVPAVPHHVTQRGNHRQDVFLDDEDRSVYLSLLAHYRAKFDCDILAYCLMPNHVHLVVTPWENDSLARMFAGMHMRYAQHFNEKYSQDGHLWQNRFFSAALDDVHTVAAARYVELNPVRAGLAGVAWEYAWSSARTHIEGLSDDASILTNLWPPRELLNQWRELISTEPPSVVEAIRQSTRRGRPLGSADFMLNLERLLGRSLQIRPRGRPRREKK